MWKIKDFVIDIFWKSIKLKTKLSFVVGCGLEVGRDTEDNLIMLYLHWNEALIGPKRLNERCVIAKNITLWNKDHHPPLKSIWYSVLPGSELTSSWIEFASITTATELQPLKSSLLLCKKSFLKGPFSPLIYYKLTALSKWQ